MENKRKFSVYLEQDLAQQVEAMAKSNCLYVSKMIEYMVNHYMSQCTAQQITNVIHPNDRVVKARRNHIDVRLLEIGIEGCLLSRKLLESRYKNSEEFDQAKREIKQQAIKFVEELSDRLYK